MPPSPWPYLDSPGPLAIAHRGGAGDAPENTLAAFQQAVDLGYRWVETDGRVTADGVLLAFHDDDLERLTGRPGKISDLPWREVAAARICGEAIPTMDDLLGAWPDVRVNIDPKQDSAVGPLAESIRRTASTRRVGIGSFSDLRLTRMRKLVGPDLCTSVGPLGIARLRLASYGLPVGPFASACAQVPMRGPGGIPLVDARLLAAAHERGMQVHVWTVDEPDEISRLLDLGIDGIMTDRPAALKDVLVRRGQW